MSKFIKEYNAALARWLTLALVGVVIWQAKYFIDAQSKNTEKIEWTVEQVVALVAAKEESEKYGSTIGEKPLSPKQVSYTIDEIADQILARLQSRAKLSE